MHISGLRFSVASLGDDLIIRELLRRVSMNRHIGISFQREPNYFAGENIGALRSKTLILTDEKRLCAYAIATRSVMKIHVNGVATEVGYISNLRSDPCVRGGRYLLYGFRFLRTLCEDDPVPYCITTIFDDNVVAKNILESGRMGLPRYVPIGKLVTYLIPLTQSYKSLSNRVISIESTLSENGELNIPERRYQIIGKSSATGLSAGDYSGYKQVVINSYSKIMTCIRVFHNLYAQICSLPKLPPVRGQLRLVYLTGLASIGSDSCATELVRHVVSDMSGRGHDYLVIGLMSDNPLLPVVDRMATRKEITTVYQVMWEDTDYIPKSNLHLEVVAL